MRTATLRTVTLLTLLLALAGQAGCSRGDEAGVAAEPPLSATATPEPSATPRPSPTPPPSPTPRPPTPTVAPTTAETGALLRRLHGQRDAIKSYRGQMELSITGQQAGKPQVFGMAMEIEAVEPDVHMKMSGGGTPSSAEMEMIVKGDTMYLKVGDRWVALEGAGGLRGNQTGAMDAEMAWSYLAGASDARSLGRRQVRGVDCEVVSFAIPPEKLWELAALSGRSSGRPRAQDSVGIDRLQAEVALAVADGLMRQMVMEMGMADKRNPAEAYTLRLVMTMWDVNAPDIVVKAPEGVQPAPIGRPRPTPTVSTPVL